MTQARRTGRPRRISAASSPASRGIVTVEDDFADEFPDGDPVAAQLISSLLRTAEAINVEMDRAMLASFDVPQSVLNSLAVIEGADTPLTPSQISDRTYTSAATITATLDNLERLGWVERAPNPADRRSVLVQITAAGQAVADQFLPGIRAVELALLADLTPAERQAMLDAIARILGRATVVAAADPIPLRGRRHRRPRG